jgi:hypothetical protein
MDLEKADAHWSQEERNDISENPSDIEEMQPHDRTHLGKPQYVQDILEKQVQPKSTNARTRETRSKTTRNNADKAHKVNADKELDFQRIDTAPRQMIAVKPTRRQDFDPSEYEIYEKI